MTKLVKVTLHKRQVRFFCPTVIQNLMFFLYLTGLEIHRLNMDAETIVLNQTNFFKFSAMTFMVFCPSACKGLIKQGSVIGFLIKQNV